MTDKDKAVQEAERVAAADEYFKARAWLMDTNDNRRIFEAGFDRAYALLSKLRAPVADETYTDENGTVWTRPTAWAYAQVCKARDKWQAAASDPVAGEAMQLLRSIREQDYLSDTMRHRIDRLLANAAPKASAPVAGEAVLRIYAEGSSRTVTEWLDGARDLPDGDYKLYAAPQASEAVREVAGVTLDGCLETLFRVGEHLGINYAECRKQPGAPSGVYIKAIEDRVSHARDTALEEAAKLMERTSRGTGATLIRAALYAQPAAEPLSNPKQFALTAAENIRTGAPYDDPAFEALCREHGIWGTAEAALCAVFWRQAGQQRADATDWSAIAAEAQVERDAARAERDALIVESQQRAAGADERTAFEATYQADYDDPGAACEREHFGKGYRAGLAAQSGAQLSGKREQASGPSHCRDKGHE